MAKSSGNKVSIKSLRRDFTKYQPLLKDIAEQALFYLGEKQVALEIHLVSSATIQKLNRLYRGKDKPTDVLSFGVSKYMVFPKTHSRELGEIYLSPEYIKMRGGDVIYLLVHGILHLLEYNHVKKDDILSMRRKEQFLMKKLKTN